MDLDDNNDGWFEPGMLLYYLYLILNICSCILTLNFLIEIEIYPIF